MKKAFAVFAIIALLSVGVLTGCSGGSEKQQSVAGSTTQLSGHTLQVYCGAGMSDPFQKIADAFTSETGCVMNVTYASAGQIQSQINTAQEGDIFIAGSSDEVEPVKNVVTETKNLVKHIPVLAVATGNPKSITGLSSLTTPGVTFVMGDAQSTPIGKIAKKALTDAGIFTKVTVAATTTTAPQLATAITNHQADATIVWKENCSMGGVEIVNTTDLDGYAKTVPAAILSYSKDAEALAKFINFLGSDKAKEIWASYGYETVE